MYVFQRAEDLHRYLSGERTNNRSIGFVPTMGALHEGHLTLIRRSLEQDQTTVCSIFVNPTQFNDAADLEKYPRTPGKDLEMLAGVGCHVAFLPPVDEIYPAGWRSDLQLQFDGLDQRLEGAFRPGHFAGVAEVVDRLLELVDPHRLYLGQKDFQQLAVLRQLVSQTGRPVEIQAVETVREADGLALSSRNMRLQPDARRAAPAIYGVLKQMKAELLAGRAPEEVKARGWTGLQEPPLRPEYLEIVDTDRLLPAGNLQPEHSYAIVTAVWAGEVRLIDNILLEA